MGSSGIPPKQVFPYLLGTPLIILHLYLFGVGGGELYNHPPSSLGVTDLEVDCPCDCHLAKRQGIGMLWLI